jgi:SPOR domain
MTDSDRELSLQDEDRLPWLEAVEDDDEDEGISSGKMLGFLLAALLAISLVMFGTWWLRAQKEGPQGDGTLIAAQEGDYKVKPTAPGGMKVEGQGDAAFAASEGAEANGKVDLAAKPEAPVTVLKAGNAPAAKPAAAGSNSVSTTMAPGQGKLVAAPAPVSGGGLVQLGAYGSQGSADQAWMTLSARQPALARLAKSVQVANVNGRTVYRLRANAGTPAAAAALCGSIGNCMVVR